MANRSQLASRCRKTKLCKFFLANKCERGDTCRYAHTQQELRTAPDLCGAQLCRAIMQGIACKDGSCRFAHSAGEVKRFPGGSSPDKADHDGGDTALQKHLEVNFGVSLRNTFLTYAEEPQVGASLRRTCSAPGHITLPKGCTTKKQANASTNMHLAVKRHAKTMCTMLAVPKQISRWSGPLPVGRVD
eukprot:TRINITY_DN42785_c0_g1_i1.p1 TRINITY_DN42785_c0_g1~~TRINITY_DN42785_c0_g1_i1.p1  ORF type:complete len:188 (-),score=23.39 TRINITY_DN42785_c0_g1_i1:148-711(-)